MQHDQTPRVVLVVSFLVALCGVLAMIFLYQTEMTSQSSGPRGKLPITLTDKTGQSKPQAKITYDFVQQGRASWYGVPFHGRTTANGERYNMHLPTAAHKSWPFGSIVHVTNLRNGKSTYVRINDRGPYIAGRNIDLSYYAAQKLGMVASGVAPVKLEVVLPQRKSRRRSSVVAANISVE